MPIPGITTEGRLWKRAAKVTLNGHLVAAFGLAASPAGSGLSSSDELGHRIRFDVERHNRVEPNKGTVTIFGLNERNRTLISKRFDHARRSVLQAGGGSVGDLVLEAGYDGATSQLTKMDVVDIEHEPLNPGWSTTITAQDGVVPWANSIVNESIVPGVSVETVMSLLAASMRIAFLDADSEKEFQAALSRFSSRAVDGGFVLQGPTRKVLTEFLESLDLAWSHQDGKLVLLRFDQARSDKAVLLSPSTGLKELGVRFRNLGRATVPAFLNARLHPGRQVSLVDSEDRPMGAGIFRIDHVKHIGDTQGGPWDSTIEVRPSRI